MTASFRARLIGAFAAIYLMWGGTFLAIRYAVADVPPLMTMVLRCAGGALVLFAWLAWRGTAPAALARTVAHGRPGGRIALPRLPWAPGLGGAAGLVRRGGALHDRDSAVARRAGVHPAPASALAPSAAESRARRGGRRGAHLGRGLGGWDDRPRGAHRERAASGRSDADRAAGGCAAPAAQSTAMQLGAGALVLLAASLAAGEPAGWSPADITPRASLALVFLILGGTVIGFGAYTWLLRVPRPPR